MRHVASVKVIPLYNALEAFTFGGSDHLDALTHLKNVALDFVAQLIVGRVGGAYLL